MVAWQDLPLDLISKIAGGRDDLRAMRLVCRSWGVGYRASVTKINLNGVSTLARGHHQLPPASFAAQFSRVKTLVGARFLEDKSIVTLQVGVYTALICS